MVPFWTISVVFGLLVLAWTAASWPTNGQEVSANDHLLSADDIVFADSTDFSATFTIDGVESVAFTNSFYGYGPLPTDSLLAELEIAYRALRAAVVARHNAALAEFDSERRDSARVAFSLRPESVLAFSSEPNDPAIVRQYFRAAQDSTDYLFVHFLERERFAESRDFDWREAQIFVDEGGPSTVYVRYNVRERRIDGVGIDE